MNINSRINLLSKLGRFFSEYLKKTNNEFNEIIFRNVDKKIEEVKHQNSFFDLDNIKNCFAYWAQNLNEKNLKKLEPNYKIENSKNILIIMAGNIPLVGFHDFLCVFICGHKSIIKKSSKDSILYNLIFKLLLTWEPKFENCFTIVDRVNLEIDAVIATGNNSTTHFFEKYFRKYPKIIRKNRNSVAILNGNESQKDLKKLMKDILLYYGLGCRSVSKIFIPKDYNLDKIFKVSIDWKKLLNNNSYNNNYNYNKSVFLLNSEKFYDNGLVILKESKKLGSPISVLYYEKYDSLDKLKKYLDANRDKLQCVVSNNLVKNSTKFGMTQSPALLEFADNVNTVDFLLKVNE